MAAFPTPPFSLNQIHTDGGRSWKWDGSRWKRVYTVIASVVSDAPPANPTVGMRWLSPTLGRSFDYVGNAWVETTSGAPGTDGRPVEFQKSATHVQWRYVGDLTWTDLVALADFAAGADGSDGREVQFQKSATHIQWRYVNDPIWTDLVALDDLKGADGNDGAAGADGNDGAAGADGNDGAAGADGADALWNFTGAYNPGQVYAIGDLATYAGETWYRKHANGGNVGDTPSEGAFWTNIAQKGLDGREVEFQKSETYIQWRYVNDPTWTDLVALDDLKGADGNDGAAGVDGNDGTDGNDGAAGVDGSDGSDGVDGREVEFQKSATHIQWRYIGDPTWTDLVALDDLKGADGNDGAAGADGNDGAAGADGSNGREVEFQKSETYIQWRYVNDPTWTDLVALDDLKADYSSSFIIAKPGDDLTTKYAQAKDLTPNGAVKTAWNRARLIIYPGAYTLASSITIDAEFVDIIGLGAQAQKPAVLIAGGPNSSVSRPLASQNYSLSVSANDVRISGISVDSYISIIGNKPLQVFENCSGSEKEKQGGSYYCSFSDPTPIASSICGTFTNCIGGLGSFGGWTGEIASSASGTFTNCIGGSGSFGSYIASGVFTNCTGGNGSFGYTGINDDGATSGTFTNCIGGSGSFWRYPGIASGVFTGCILTSGTFPQLVNPATGKARMTNCIDGNGDIIEGEGVIL